MSGNNSTPDCHLKTLIRKPFDRVMFVYCSFVCMFALIRTGMFFQWILCAGIWLTGLIVQIVRQSTFYPIVMVGGVIWATGELKMFAAFIPHFYTCLLQIFMFL